MKNLVDKMGMFVSGLCIVHCLFIPVVVVGSGFFGWYNDKVFHALFVLAAIPLVYISLMRYNPKFNLWLWLLGNFGLLCLIGGVFAREYDREWTLAGGIILSIVHFWNWNTKEGYRIHGIK